MTDLWVWPAALCLGLGGFFLARKLAHVEALPDVLSGERKPEHKTSKALSSQISNSPVVQGPPGTSAKTRPPMPRRFRGGSAGLAKQEEAGSSGPAQMNAMRNAIGLALQADGLAMKKCIDQTEYPSVRVTFRFDVLAGRLHLDARAPRVVEGPVEVGDCLKASLAATYNADTTAEDPFLDGYSGSVDVHATIHRNNLEP